MSPTNAAAEPARRPGGTPGPVVCVAAAVLAFAGTAFALRALVPWPEEYGLRAKVEFLEQHLDEYDVLVIGSSRVYRGIDPLVVEAELAREGVPLRVFNAAVGGMYPFERDHLLRWVLQQRPTRLKWVLLESEFWDPSADLAENRWATRTVHWHDRHETRLLLRAIERFDASHSERHALAWVHLQLCAMKQLNMGQGRRIVLNLFGERRDPLGRGLSPEQLEAGQGYQSLEALAPAGKNSWARILANDPDFPRRLAQHVRDRRLRPARLDTVDVETLRAQVAACRAAGIELVHLLPPANDSQAEILELARRGDLPHLLDFSDPDRHPEFYGPDSRFDEVHLDEDSARELSRLVGQGLAELVKAR